MTVSIKVSVNGNYKLPVTVKQGERSEGFVLSGRGKVGPDERYISFNHGPDAMSLEIGPEEQDNGEPAAELDNDTIA